MKKFTVAGLIRARFEQIEQLRYEGMTQTAIVEKLNEELKDVGFKTTVENFRNELHRAKKRRAGHGSKSGTNTGSDATSSGAKPQEKPDESVPKQIESGAAATQDEPATEQSADSETQPNQRRIRNPAEMRRLMSEKVTFNKQTEDKK